MSYRVTNVTKNRFTEVQPGQVGTIRAVVGDILQFTGAGWTPNTLATLYSNGTPIMDLPVIDDGSRLNTGYFDSGPIPVQSDVGASQPTRVSGFVEGNGVNSGTINLTNQETFATMNFSATGGGHIEDIDRRTVSGAIAYPLGTVFTMYAVPNPGSYFVRWELNGQWLNTATATLNSVAVNGDSYVAIFSSTTYSITKNITPVGSGQIRTSVNGVITDGPFNQYDVVTVQAIPLAGSTFTGWGGDLTGTANPQTLNMTANKSVTATFTKIRAVLILDTEGSGVGSIVMSPQGTAEVTGITFEYGTLVTLTAIPDGGSTFNGWTGTNNNTANPTTVKMDADRTVTATFTLTGGGGGTTFTLTTSITPAGGGTLNVPPTSVRTPNSDAILQATPAEGYGFAGWSGDASGKVNPIAVFMNGNKTVVANFALIPPPPPIDLRIVVGGIIVAGVGLALLFRKG